jgi:hypothetical protein
LSSSHEEKAESEKQKSGHERRGVQYIASERKEGLLVAVVGGDQGREQGPDIADSGDT